MFAGSCIGVICLVCCLELLRRLGKEYDIYLVRQFERQSYRRIPSESSDDPLNTGPRSGDAKDVAVTATRQRSHKRTFKPNALQQFTRALLHMLQLA